MCTCITAGMKVYLGFRIILFLGLGEMFGSTPRPRTLPPPPLDRTGQATPLCDLAYLYLPFLPVGLERTCNALRT